jgi:hypothetical protein
MWINKKSLLRRIESLENTRHANTKHVWSDLAKESRQDSHLQHLEAQNIKLQKQVKKLKKYIKEGY